GRHAHNGSPDERSSRKRPYAHSSTSLPNRSTPGSGGQCIVRRAVRACQKCPIPGATVCDVRTSTFVEGGAQLATIATLLSASSLHELRATPATCFWGFFDRDRPPVLRVRSGDLVSIETLTHQAGDAPDLMMDSGVEAVYAGIPLDQRGPGVHIMTGPIAVEG